MYTSLKRSIKRPSALSYWFVALLGDHRRAPRLLFFCFFCFFCSFLESGDIGARVVFTFTFTFVSRHKNGTRFCMLDLTEDRPCSFSLTHTTACMASRSHDDILSSGRVYEDIHASSSARCYQGLSVLELVPAPQLHLSLALSTFNILKELGCKLPCLLLLLQ
jgi:hypothetical protein